MVVNGHRISEVNWASLVAAKNTIPLQKQRRPTQTELGYVDLLMSTRSKSTLPASADKQVSGNVNERGTHRTALRATVSGWPCVQGSPRKMTFLLLIVALQV
jgi:hypothetical protein